MSKLWNIIQAVDTLQEVEWQIDGLRALLRISRDDEYKPNWQDNGIDFVFDNIARQLSKARGGIESDLEVLRKAKKEGKAVV